jgi:hypothetical protein
MENKHYIYLHRNPSNYEVFYVGQGKVDKNGKFTRSKSKCSRSRWWNNYVNKHGNPIVEVIEENLSIDEVNLREKFYTTTQIILCMVKTQKNVLKIIQNHILV